MNGRSRGRPRPHLHPVFQAVIDERNRQHPDHAHGVERVPRPGLTQD